MITTVIKKRILSILLSGAMMFTLLPSSYISVYADTIESLGPGFAELLYNEASPSDAPKATASVVLKATAEDGVTVVVTADAGTIPEDTTVTANIVTDPSVSDSVDQVSDENTAKRVTYNISLWNNGSEIEPDTTQGSVKVSFVIPEEVMPSGTDGIDLYHHTETSVEKILDETELLVLDAETVDEIKKEQDHIENMEPSEEEHHEHDEDASDCDCCGHEENEDVIDSRLLDINKEVIDAVGDTINAADEKEVVLLEANIASFSYYTVDFTYNDKIVSIPGDEAVVLSGVLELVGINGDIQNAEMSADADGLVSVYQESGVWMIKGLTAFDTKHTLTVKITDGSTYVVTVTDDSTCTAIIRGYAKHETTNLRASELLEVYTTGFSSTADLQYTYKVYNSSSDASGKNAIEIYPSSNQSNNDGTLIKYSSSTKSVTISGTAGNYYYCEPSATSYKYFSVTNREFNASGIVLVVTVIDKNSTDTATVTYSGFEHSDLSKDVANSAIIMFVDDDTMEITKWYGLSGITHIACSQASTGAPTLTPTGIVSVQSNSGKYSLTPQKVGETVMSVTVSKTSNCWQHNYKGQTQAPSTNANTKIYVIPHPTFSGDTTTFINNVKKDFTYTINGKSATASSDSDTLELQTPPVNDAICEISITIDGVKYAREEKVSVHSHAWNYSLAKDTTDNDSIKAYCSQSTLSDGCGFYGAANAKVVTIVPPSSLTYDGDPKTATLKANKDGTTKIGTYTIPAISYVGVSGTTYAESTTGPSAPGNYKASITVGSFTAYTNFTIGKITDSITSLSIENWTYSGTPNTVNCTVTSGRTPTYTYYKKDNSGNYSILVTDLANASAGDYKLVAHLDANDTYTSADAETTFTINKKPVSVTGVTVKNKTYDGTTNASVDNKGSLDGKKTGDDLDYTVTPEFANKNNGLQTVNLTFALTGTAINNYQLSSGTSTTTATIYKKEIKVVNGVQAANKTYDKKTSATISNTYTSWSIEGIVGLEVVYPVITGAFSDPDIGNNKTVTLSYGELQGADKANYVLASTGNQAATTANITGKSITIPSNAVTADTKTYDNTTSATIHVDASKVTGLEDGDSVVISATGAYASELAGTTTVNITGYTITGGTNYQNYSIVFDDQPKTTTGKINKKTVTIQNVTAKNKAYDGNCVAELVFGSNSVDGKINGDEVIPSASGEFADKNKGTWNVTISAHALSGADSANYELDTANSQQSTTASISQRELTFTGEVKGETRTYNSETGAKLDFSGVTIIGIQGSEDVKINATGTFMDSTGTDPDRHVGTNKIIAIKDYVVTGSDAANYYITDTGKQTQTTGTITKKTVTVDGIKAKDKVYDKKKDAVLEYFGLQIDGVYSGDVVFAQGTGTFENENVGKNKTVYITGLYLGGGDAGNYTISEAGSQKDTKADITAKNLNIPQNAITADNKQYNGNTTAVLHFDTSKIQDLISGDEITLFAKGNFADENAGTNKKVFITDYAISGPSGGNYEINNGSKPEFVNADITPREVVVSDIKASDKIYDGNTNATLTYDDLKITGNIDGANLKAQAVGKFETASVGVGKKVVLSNLELTGSKASNYVLSSTGNQTHAFATISQKEINISGAVKANNKVYDGNDSAELDFTGTSLVGVETGDKVSVTATGKFSDELADTGKTVTINDYQLTGKDAENYILSDSGKTNSTTADITKKTVMVYGAAGINKVYDKTKNAALNYNGLTIFGKLNSDDVSATATAEFVDEKVGTKKAVYITNWELKGTRAGNYQLAASGNQDLTVADITAKPIIVKDGAVTAEDKEYDGDTDATLHFDMSKVEGIESGDEVIISATGTFDSKWVAEGKLVTINGYSITGKDAAQYSIEDLGQQSSAIASIKKRKVTVSGIKANDKIYDGNKYAELVYSDLKIEFIVGGETVSAVAEGEFEDANAGTGKTVYLKNLTLTGKDKGNYEIKSDSQKTAFASISKSEDGKGTLEINGWIYKEYDPSKNTPVVTSPTHDINTVKYYYQKEGETVWKDVIPEDAGKYIVKAVLPENTNYKQLELTKEFVINKKKVATPSVAAKYYNGNRQIADTSDTKDYVVSENKGGINAGNYNVELTLVDPDNYTWIDDNSAPTTNLIFTIIKAIVNELKKLKIDDWTYQDPDAPKKPEIEADFGQETVQYTYVGKDYEYGPTSEPPTEAGTYYLIAYIPGTDNYPEIKQQIEFTIYPKLVEEPVINSKVYNGQNQVADVPTNPLYIVKENNGGVNVGLYDVVLELVDHRNYKWTKTKEKKETLKFEITKKPETVIEDLKIDDWTYEETPNPPSAKTPYGDEIIYYYIGRNGTEYGPSTTPPTDAGDYYLVAEVKENPNHGPAKEMKPFTINRKPIPVPEIDEKVYNGKHQYPYIVNDPRFIVTVNDGGEEVGSYDVKVVPNKNYCWITTDPEEKTKELKLDFPIVPDPQNIPGQQDKPHEYNSGEATIETSTNCDAEAPKTVVQNLDLKLAYELLTPEEKAAYDAGNDVEIKIYMEVKGIKEENVPKTEAEEIKKEVSKLPNAKVGLYLDLTLNKEITYSSTGITEKSKITNTKGNMVVITVTVPESLRRAGRTYYVVRVHEGVSETIYGPTECDANGEITFETDLFSTYAVVVNDPVAEEGWNNWWKYSDNGWTFRDANQKWYYITNHNLKYGWHTDPEDGYKYYLDPVTGIMATGWTQIDGKWYFFNDEPDTQTWFQGTNGEWHYNNDTKGHRPLGSMYRDEMTPDGYFVDSNGVYIEKKTASKFWGDLDNGWYNVPDTDDWYYITNGALKKGWHHDPEDGKWYYLDLNSGIMYTGWHTIEGKQYFFNPPVEINTWIQNKLGRWVYLTKTKDLYKPFGSMYENEITPDGYTVGTDGAKK